MQDLALLDYFNSWDSTFRSRYVPTWPDTYLCVDTEYDSQAKEHGLIWEIGHVLVVDGVVQSRGNYVLNWYTSGKYSAETLDRRLADIESRVGFEWRLKPQVVQAEGVDPIKVLRFYRNLFSRWERGDGCFVLQNGQAADEVLFASNFSRHLSQNFAFPHATYFDTGCLFKAYQAWQDPTQFGRYKSSFTPNEMDTPKSYFSRVSHTKAKGLRWKLGLVIDTFNLLEKYAAGPTNYHNALYDAECLHWIMQEFGRVYKMLSPPSAAAPTNNLSPETFAAIVTDELAGPRMFGYPPGQPPTTVARQRRV